MKGNLKLNLNLNVVYKKHTKYFNCYCEDLNMKFTSLISFEDAEKKLIEFVCLEIWSGGIDLAILTKQKFDL